MNLFSLKSLGRSSILVFVIASGLTCSYAEAREKEANQIEKETAPEENTAGKVVIGLLRACLVLNNDSRTLNDFSRAILAILEDPAKAAEFKKEYPSIDVKALIAALKKIQNKTSAVFIGQTLKPFFKYLPQDLQNIPLPTLWAVIKKRVANQ